MAAGQRMTRRLALLALLAASAQTAQAADAIEWRASEPRSYGYQLGDLIVRDIELQLPPGLALAADALPGPAHVNRYFDLLRIERSTPAPGHERLRLTWQVTGVRDALAFVDLPGLDLRLAGPGGEQTLAIDGRRVAVAPVAPADAEPELIDDRPPRRIDAGPARRQTLTALAALATLALGWLARRHLLPRLLPARRPFALAWRALRRQRGTDASLAAACATLHGALNASAGRVLLAEDLPDFLRQRPAFAPAQAELLRFFADSRRLLFGGQPPADAAAARAALLRLGRQLRDLERAA
ncbi:hypothetical protein [Derxia lacustris]|uniref:hypothetical protein n=1 Tax=Derxia lacustris TaxID=764842 RepID=UPI00111BF79E|nr:hypothetical protein [Derxia lacustris]